LRNPRAGAASAPPDAGVQQRLAQKPANTLIVVAGSDGPLEKLLSTNTQANQGVDHLPESIGSCSGKAAEALRVPLFERLSSKVIVTTRQSYRHCGSAGLHRHFTFSIRRAGAVAPQGIFCREIDFHRMSGSFPLAMCSCWSDQAPSAASTKANIFFKSALTGEALGVAVVPSAPGWKRLPPVREQIWKSALLSGRRHLC